MKSGKISKWILFRWHEEMYEFPDVLKSCWCVEFDRFAMDSWEGSTGTGILSKWNYHGNLALNCDRRFSNSLKLFRFIRFICSILWTGLQHIFWSFICYTFQRNESDTTYQLRAVRWLTLWNTIFWHTCKKIKS